MFKCIGLLIVLIFAFGYPDLVIGTLINIVLPIFTQEPFVCDQTEP